MSTTPPNPQNPENSLPSHGSQPYGQSAPVPEKKSKKGLWIGLAIGALALIAILIAAILLLSRGGANKSYDSREEFTGKIDEALEGSSLEHCSPATETLLKEEFESAAEGEDFTADDIYFCSDVDFSSFESVLSAETEDPATVFAIYGGDLTTDEAESENVAKDLQADDGWGVYGKNWVVIGTGGNSGDVKQNILDTVGGEEITSQK